MNRDELKESMEIPVDLGSTASIDRYVSLSFIPYTLKYRVTYETEKGRYESEFHWPDQALDFYNEQVNK